MKRQTNNQLFAPSLPGKRAKVVILMQPHLLSRCGPKRDKRQTQLGRTLVNRWQYNFNSGILASGKTRMAPKKSKFPAAWWLASNLTDAPLFMKCQTNNQKSHIIPNRNLDRRGKTGRCCYLQLRSFTLFALHDLYLGSGSCAKLVILALLPLPQRCGTTWAKQQTQLGRTLVARWQYNFNSGTFASGKTGWLPRQTNLPLHGGWRRKGKICRWPWNIKPTIS